MGTMFEVAMEVNKGCSTDVKLFSNPGRITNEIGGAKQGDSSSPKLFTAYIEMVLCKTEVSDNAALLCFADNTVLITNNARGINEMLQELKVRRKRMGLKISG